MVALHGLLGQIISWTILPFGIVLEIKMTLTQILNNEVFISIFFYILKRQINQDPIVLHNNQQIKLVDNECSKTYLPFMPEVVYDSNILLVFCLPVRFRYSQKWVSPYVPEVIFLLYIIKHIVLVRLSEILADQKNGRVKASVKWKSV